MRNEQGKFTEGNPGRPKGAANKATTLLREQVSKLLAENYE